MVCTLCINIDLTSHHDVSVKGSNGLGWSSCSCVDSVECGEKGAKRFSRVFWFGGGRAVVVGCWLLVVVREWEIGWER